MTMPSPTDTNASPVTPAQLQELLGSMFAPWVQDHVHGGGVLCGQTLMAAADTAMVLAVSAQLGGFRPMTTVQLQTSFLRPVPKDAGEVTVVARVLKPGRQLVFGEIECLLPDGKLAAHATTTYALL
jgi:uncharacterized protein (TIGR00369 family)